MRTWMIGPRIGTGIGPRIGTGIGLAALAALPGAAAAGNTDGMVAVPDAAVRWEPGPPALPKGVEISRLSGDPGKAGPFVLRVRVPAGTVIAPHTHATPETLTILSGAIHHAHGATLDRAKGRELRAGGFVYLPADMPHSLWTTDGPVDLQVNGTGPFGLIYVNPADDPSRKS